MFYTLSHIFLVQSKVILFGGLTVACEQSAFLKDIKGDTPQMLSEANKTFVH